MRLYLPRTVVVCAAALLALSPAMARSSPENVADQLSLQQLASSSPGVVDSLFDEDQDRVLDQSMTLDAPPAVTASKVRPETNMAGLDFADLKNSVYALAMRQKSGLGLGVASSGGLAITGGFATKDGLQVSLYYVERVREIEAAAREIGIEDLPARTIGLTVGWKF